MGLFKIDNIRAITFKNSIGLNDGTFDANYIYLVDGHSTKIIIANNDLKTCTFIDTTKIFDYITYDNNEKCFWAYSKLIFDRFFKLDEHMNEIGYIKVPNCNSKKIKSLSYNQSHNCLTISSRGLSMDINKNSILTNNISLPDSIYSTYTYCFDTFNLSLGKIDSTNVLLLCQKHKKIALFKLPKNIKYKSIIKASKNSNIINLELLILDNKNHSYIAYCSINLNDYFKIPKHNYCLENFTYQCKSLTKPK